MEDVCRKEKLEKAEGERGRKLGRTGSSSPQLENFPSATTGCDTGPRSCSSFLGHIRGMRHLPLAHMASGLGAPIPSRVRRGEGALRLQAGGIQPSEQVGWQLQSSFELLQELLQQSSPPPPLPPSPALQVLGGATQMCSSAVPWGRGDNSSCPCQLSPGASSHTPLFFSLLALRTWKGSGSG